jgi:hypothetical protein
MFPLLIINVPNRIRLDPHSIETETEPDIGTSDIGLKRAESEIMLDIGIKCVFARETKGCGFDSNLCNLFKHFNIGYLTGL